MKVKQAFITLFTIALLSQPCFAGGPGGKADNSPAWFYPEWAAKAEYSEPISVRDTDSALGRYNRETKEIGLKDLARMHGHLCDGLVIAFVQIKAALKELFPDGVIDRTDLRTVSKNSPCLIDAAMIMTGARINFQTLRVDNSIGMGFIIQRISTEDAYEVRLKPGVFPREQADLENEIRRLSGQGKPLPPEMIDKTEKMADALSLKILSTPPSELLEITRLPDYEFRGMDLLGERGDIINKNMPR